MVSRQMKLNEDKCHLMVFGDKSNDVSLNIGRITIKESTYEKLVGVILDKKLCFNQQVKSIHFAFCYQTFRYENCTRVHPKENNNYQM